MTIPRSYSEGPAITKYRSHGNIKDIYASHYSPRLKNHICGGTNAHQFFSLMWCLSSSVTTHTLLLAAVCCSSEAKQLL